MAETKEEPRSSWAAALGISTPPAKVSGAQMPVGGPPTPTAVAKPPVPKDSGRRNFIKALFAIGAILSIAPFVPWGTFLSSSVSTGNAKRTLLQKVVIDDVQKYGAAAGKEVNVNDIATFPPNSHWVITYPSSGDLTIDAQDPDTFLKYELIRLPTALGGGDKKATDFVAFSKVCVHLWCSPNYNPSAGHQQYECPCHGSIYEVPDGKAVQGPASLQPAPTNAIPMLTLQADSTGALYVVYPNRDPTKPLGSDMVNSIEGNGELGYGRDYNSYQGFVRQLGQVPADPKGLTQEIA